MQSQPFIPRIITGAEVVAQARTLMGTRFRHRGETPEGVDCSGVCVCVGKRLGQIPEDYERPTYGLRPDPRVFLQMLRFGRVIDRAEVRDGDVLLLSHGSDYTKVRHCAVRATYEPKGWPTLIHIHPGASIARVSEHTFDEVWERRILGALRWNGVAD